MSASRYLATHASPANNPYARLAVPSYSGCTRNNYQLDKRAETVPPVYCGGIEVAGGATLNLEPGAYILDQGNFAVGGTATVNGAGVTIILTSRTGSSYGTVDIRGGSTIAISAPIDGAAGKSRGSPSGSTSMRRPPAPFSTAALPRTSTVRSTCRAAGCAIPEVRPPGPAAVSWWR